MKVPNDIFILTRFLTPTKGEEKKKKKKKIGSKKKDAIAYC